MGKMSYRQIPEGYPCQCNCRGLAFPGSAAVIEMSTWVFLLGWAISIYTSSYQGSSNLCRMTSDSLGLLHSRTCSHVGKILLSLSCFFFSFIFISTFCNHLLSYILIVLVFFRLILPQIDCFFSSISFFLLYFYFQLYDIHILLVYSY